jgi:heme oxygenase (biliverdin-IX-beta and delta-forming)
LNLDRLRRETTADHRAVEGSLTVLMAQELDQDSYVSCLRRMHGVVAAWEERSAANSPPWLRSLLAGRQRRILLENDLAWFGVVDLDGKRPALPKMNDEASLLGAMYVIEGSTFGGRLIARHVECVLKMSGGQGNAYFRGHNERTGTMWQEFCDVLRNKIPDTETTSVISGAKAMFQVFGSWMRLDA